MYAFQQWRSAATIGTFALLASAAVSMLFHPGADPAMAAREWLLVFVVAVTLHAFTDFGSPLTQLRKPVRLAIAALLVGVTGLSVLGAAGSAPPAPADRVVMQSLAQLPIGRLMPMTGRSTDAMIESLSAMGVSDVNVGSSIRSLSGHDRRRESQLLAAVFRDE